MPLSVKKKVGGAYVSRTDYEYDQNDLADAPDVIQHDPSYNEYVNTPYECNCRLVCNDYGENGVCIERERVCQNCTGYNEATDWRGNVTKIKSFVNPTNDDDPDASITTFKYDITGNATEASLNCCNVKTWEYNASNQYAYPTKETKGAGITLITQAEYNFPTGLVTKTIDENNQNTLYEYEADTLRRKKITYPNGGYTETEYSDKLISAPSQLVPGFVRDDDFGGE
jgi:hypothetical protein